MKILEKNNRKIKQLNKFVEVYKNMYIDTEDEKYKDEVDLNQKMLKRENIKKKRLILREKYNKL